MANIGSAVPQSAPDVSVEYAEQLSESELSDPGNPQIDPVGTLVNRCTVFETVPKTSKPPPNGSATHIVKLAPLVDHSQPVLPTARVAVRRLNDDGVIKVGRLERTDESSHPIVYTSKVVSRNHAEIILKDGSWFVRDIGSSSGTFLNNERLSPALKRSEMRQVNTGDVVRFGVDFRGGVEPCYRAIRVRIEIDGGNSRQPQEFQKAQFEKLKGMAKDNGKSELETCTICLEEISPFSSLFLAPCCHLWHYKCIRSTVVSKYPFFECPLCRKTYDLEDASEDDDECDDKAC